MGVQPVGSLLDLALDGFLVGGGDLLRHLGLVDGVADGEGVVLQPVLGLFWGWVGGWVRRRFE